MSTTTKPTWNAEQVVALLERVPLFDGLPRQDLERIAGLMRGRAVAAEEMLFREGDPGDKFYVVYTGALEILKERPKGDHERLAIKRAGEAFGEMSLLTDAPRSASVRAVEPSQLLVCSREQFVELLGGETLSVRMMRALARSLRALDVRFAARETTQSGSDGAGALREFNRLIQAGLMPRELPPLEGYETASARIANENTPTRSAWDIVEYGDGALVAVMDVKGGAAIPPAHFVAIARALFRQAARHGDDLAHVLAMVNVGLAESLHEGLDACVECGLMGLNATGARFSAAGEQPAVVVRATETETLEAHGPALGILPRFDYGATELLLWPGDCVLLFSELEPGVVQGAAELVRAHSARPAQELVGLVDSALRQYRAKTGSDDDVTFTIVKKV